MFSHDEVYLSRVTRKPTFPHMRKQKPQICFVVTAKLISAFLFAAWIVQYLYNFQPLTIFCSSKVRFVSDLVVNPERWFSHDAAHFASHSPRLCPLI